MDFFNALCGNTVLVSAVSGWFVAQVLKTIIYLILNKQFRAERLVGSGGMPSSHSATGCALATASCLEFGPGGFPQLFEVLVHLVLDGHDLLFGEVVGVDEILRQCHVDFLSAGLADYYYEALVHHASC